MTDVTPELLARLREAAEGVDLAGDWHAGRYPISTTNRHDIAHIAAASPDVVVALVAEVERLRAREGAQEAQRADLSAERLAQEYSDALGLDDSLEERRARFERTTQGAPVIYRRKVAEQGASGQGGAHACDTGWFDRTICPEPCGSMHSYCDTCGDLQDDCAHEGKQPDHPDEFEAWIGRAMIGEEQGWGA